MKIISDSQQPDWLDKWPEEAQILALVTPTMRYVALSLCNRENLELHWDSKHLYASIGAIKCTWSLVDGLWKRRCTCGYKNDACLHAYATHLMLKEVCRKNQWTLPNAVEIVESRSSVRTAPASVRPLPPRPITPRPLTSRPASSRPVTSVSSSKPAFQTDFFSELGSVSSPAEASLEVEAEFTGNAVHVRFYLKSLDRRTLLEVGKLRYLASDAMAANADRPGEYVWQEKDKVFFKWLLPFLRRIAVNGRIMEHLWVSKEDFYVWMRHWEDTPGRFIERGSQQVLNQYDIRTPVSLHVELFDAGDSVKVAAVFDMPDGRKIHTHHLLKIMREDPSHFYIEDRVRKFESPIPWDVLLRNFAHSTMEIDKGSVCSVLPRAINYRLDLISPGPCVKLIRRGASQVSVEAGMDEHGFVISLFNNGSLIPIDVKNGGANQIRRVNGYFEITIQDDTALRKVTENISNFAGKMPDVRHNMVNGRLRVEGSRKGAEKMLEFWKAVPDGIKKHASNRMQGLLGDKGASTEISLSIRENHKLVELSACLRCGNEVVNLGELNRAMASGSPVFRSSGGEWFRLEPDKVASAIQALADEGLDGRPTCMLPTDAARKMSSLMGKSFVELTDQSVPFARKLERTEYPEAPSIRESLLSVLRPYQKIGFDFLAERCRYGVGAILADDMGLGKTVQVLALLDAYCRRDKANGKPFKALVVSPASVVDVWISQAAVFCPGLSAVAVRGSKEIRERILSKEHVDIYVTHYGLARADIGRLSRMDFSFAVLDEAQAIKNPDAMVTEAVRCIKAECRLALTGTPLENSLQDLWSIMDFLNPGLCGGREDFSNSFASDAGRSMLSRRLSLLMMRRNKSLVAPELPLKTEEVVKVEMPEETRDLYERELARAKMSRDQNGFTAILAAITRLRRFCCAPSLVLEGKAPASPKLEYLMERLEELTEAGHSILVFSQFTSMLDLISRRLEKEKMPYFTITGDTPVNRRGSIVESFNNSEQASVFLLSLKAAGTGLTLTKADYVFLFDPWWNPAAENQAIDRTHRIGQDKPVFAYRIVMEDSIEEKVMAIVEQKRELFAAVIEGADADGERPRLSLEELRGLIS